MQVEPVEVDKLCRRVYFSLMNRLALAEHCGRVERGAPSGGKQIRRLQKDGCPVDPVPLRPLLVSFGGSLDCRLYVFPAGSMPAAQPLSMTMGHYRVH